jgi:HK97 gp10 family phage protein
MAAGGATVSLKWNSRALSGIADSAPVVSHLETIGDQVGRRAQALAPRRTGAGARSIHAEVITEGSHRFVAVSWDRRHFYMGFQELGTANMRPHPFLRPAASSIR